MSAGQILLIDDDELFLLVAQNALHDAGYQVITTSDGPEGIEIYRRRQPELVILDIGLPSMGGLRVLESLVEFDPSAKVIVITGYGCSPLAEAAFNLGAIDFLSKPCTAESLLETIQFAVAL